MKKVPLCLVTKTYLAKNQRMGWRKASFQDNDEKGISYHSQKFSFHLSSCVFTVAFCSCTYIARSRTKSMRKLLH